MKFRFFILLVFLTMLVGCEKKIDATTKEIFIKSIDSIEADLPDNKYIDFTVAVDRLTIKSILPLQSLNLDENISDDELKKLAFEEVKKTFDGKTADELIQESKEYAKEQGW